MQNIEELAGLEVAHHAPGTRWPGDSSPGGRSISTDDATPKKRTVKIRSPIIARPAPAFHQAPPKSVNWGPVVTGIGLIYVLSIGAIDLVTPHGMHFDFFYLLGCALVGWCVGVRSGVLLVGFSAALLVLEDAHAASGRPLAWTMWWNSAARIAGFTATVWLASKAGGLMRSLETTIRDRTASMQSEVEEHRTTLAQLRDTLQIF